MSRSSATRPGLATLRRADIEARFSAATRGGAARPLPERLAALTDNELAIRTANLERWQHECGCSAGAWAIWIAVVVAVVAGVTRGASNLRGALALSALGLTFVGVVTVVAKLTAVAVARRRWRRDRDVILAQLATVEGAGHVVVR